MTAAAGRCSIGSIAGSRPGCKRPQIEKEGATQWVCRTCGYVFSVMIKEAIKDIAA